MMVPQSQNERRFTRFLDGPLRRAVWRRLEMVRRGRLVVEDGQGRGTFGQAKGEGLAATLQVHDPRFYHGLVFDGSLGAAEAYLRGYWSCDDLVGLVRIFCQNPAVSAAVESGPARLLGPLRRIAHLLRRNTTAGSRRNIAAHYDLGDDFFALFLDETMAYSCAIFPEPQATLHEASLAKFDRICRKLALAADDHLLEIGSGWGGLAIFAAQQYGCRVTTTTISRRQFEFTKKRIEAAGLADRVEVLCEDYRNLQGTFDKLVSVEMIEAVGYEYFDTYFRVCSERLKADGMMLLQAIVIPDQRFDRYRRSVDFIQRLRLSGRLPAVDRGHLPVAGPPDRLPGLPPRGHHAALRRNAGNLAAAVPRESRSGEKAGMLRGVHPHLGVLLLLL